MADEMAMASTPPERVLLLEIAPAAAGSRRLHTCRRHACIRHRTCWQMGLRRRADASCPGVRSHATGFAACTRSP